MIDVRALAKQTWMVLTSPSDPKDALYLASPDDLTRFAALVIEECAKVVEGYRSGVEAMEDYAGPVQTSKDYFVLTDCAAAIRALAGSPNEEKGAR